MKAGDRFGLWTVIDPTSTASTRYRVLCKCDCGLEKTVARAELIRGGSTNCGCVARVPYPFSRKLKDLYRNMTDRCGNPRNKKWNDYGGRGISVCAIWIDNRREFYRWATENGYQPGLEIDRIDNNGNYEPENCRFVTRSAQMSNTRVSRLIEWQGKVQTVTAWERELGLNPDVLGKRIRKGWSVERAMTQHVRGSHL